MQFVLTVFPHFADTIGHEKGLSGPEIAPDSFEHIVWSRFLASESFHTSGQKVGLCRWFHVFVSLRRLFDDWTSLLVVLVRANLDEPWMCASVFHGNTVKSDELEGGTPGVGGKKWRRNAA